MTTIQWAVPVLTIQWGIVGTESTPVIVGCVRYELAIGTIGVPSDAAVDTGVDAHIGARTAHSAALGHIGCLTGAGLAAGGTLAIAGDNASVLTGLVACRAVVITPSTCRGAGGIAMVITGVDAHRGAAIVTQNLAVVHALGITAASSRTAIDAGVVAGFAFRVFTTRATGAIITLVITAGAPMAGHLKVLGQLGT